MVKSLVIDVEKHDCDNLVSRMKIYCSEINIVGVCNYAQTALLLIRQLD